MQGTVSIKSAPSHLLYFEVVGDPKPQVGDEEKGDNVSTVLFGSFPLRYPLVLKIRDED